jgi:hypothetical protein
MISNFVIVKEDTCTGNGSNEYIRHRLQIFKEFLEEDVGPEFNI